MRALPMNTPILPGTKPVPHHEPVDPTGITVLYEDRITGIRAKFFSDQLAGSLGHPASFVPDCWRLELVCLPQMAAAITHSASASEFVILSLRGDEFLSVEAKEWIEAWLDCVRDQGVSLIALFDPERSARSSVESSRCYLRNVTAAAGVAFFSHSQTTLGRWEDAAVPEERGPYVLAKPPARSRRRFATPFPSTVAA